VTDGDMEAKAQGAWARFTREEHLRGLRFGPKPPKPRDKKRKLEKRDVPAVSITTPEELERYVGLFRRAFRYRSTQERALLYLLGLLSDLERKNGETMEAGIPGATQQGVWDFLVRSPWSAEALDRARVEHFASSCGVVGRPMDVVIDEVSEVKQGKLSVGVARQYLGCVGKRGNGQVTVTLHGLVDEYDLPLCGQLYLPEEWATDAERRQASRVPEELRFQTKLELAHQLLQRVIGWGLTIGRVYGDPGYGELKLMRQFDEQGWAYCLGVKSTFSVRLPEEPVPPVPAPPPYAGTGRPRKLPVAQPHLHTVAEIRQALPSEAWRRVNYRFGTDGRTLAREFAAMRVWPATKAQQGIDMWLLLERPLDPSSTDTKQYLITGPETMTLDELAQLAHRRPIIERNSYENGKQEVGLAEYQGRSWPGFHHHLAMVWLALTWLHLHRRRLPPPDDPKQSPRNTPPVSVEPPAASQSARDLDLGLSTGTVSVQMAADAPVPLDLPRQVWESVQAVRRCLCAWFDAVLHLELLLAAFRPSIPSLDPCLAGP
jgi:SRSO17 transposase